MEGRCASKDCVGLGGGAGRPTLDAGTSPRRADLAQECLEAAAEPVNSFRLTPLARDDLFDIWVHIASENFEAADRLEADILGSCERLAKRPDIGHFRRDLTDKPVRFFRVRMSYLIVYNPAAEPLQIVRILHGARNLPTLLEG